MYGKILAGFPIPPNQQHHPPALRAGGSGRDSKNDITDSAL